MFSVFAWTLSGVLGGPLALTIGTGLGGLLPILAVAFGLSALVPASAEVFTMMKLLGGICVALNTLVDAAVALAAARSQPATG